MACALIRKGRAARVWRKGRGKGRREKGDCMKRRGTGEEGRII